MYIKFLGHFVVYSKLLPSTSPQVDRCVASLVISKLEGIYHG